MLKRVMLVLCLMTGAFALAACESAEERAEKHYQTGMALLEQGDVDRAMVEFRNVFQLNGRHLEARLTYARLERERGSSKAAYSQYLRVVEQYPDNFEALRALSELAVEAQDWKEVERHATAAAAINLDDPLIRAIQNAAAYQATLQSDDSTTRDAVVAEARKLVPELPDSLISRRVLIDYLLRTQDWQDALAEIDAAIVIKPELRDLYTLRLGVLDRLGDTALLEAQLQDMTQRFPDDPAIHATLVRWYLARDNVEAAEGHLRDELVRLSSDPEKLTDARMTLVRFLTEVRSPEAARAELDTIIAINPDNAQLFRALRAGLDFDAGQQEAAISEMENILKDAQPSIETNNIRIGLAQMLFTTGNQVGARAQVEQVLANDATQIEALKLKADWLIDDDKTGDAILTLRAALNESPNDPEIMSLMARAHERDGNRDLMREMLSLAVEASNRAPEESLRYALFLASEAEYPTAEEVLLNALRLAPDNLELLATTGRLYLKMEDWLRGQQVIDRLQQIDSPQAKQLANGLTIGLYNAQKRDDDLMSFLQGLSAEGGGGLAADAALIQSYVEAGKTNEALAYAREMLEKAPNDPGRRFIYGSVLSIAGSDAEAETVFRELLADNDQLEGAWQALYGLQAMRGDPDMSLGVLDEALAALPRSVGLRWSKASTLQLKGDLDGAIAIYEELYGENTDSMVFANNLASLLSTVREDPESLERASVVARRLRGSEVPAYQDTYGWIAYRQGNLDEALSYLEPAAKALTGDPSVQFHLGMTYAGLGRTAEALAQFDLAQTLIGPSFPPGYAAQMAEERARLEAAPAGAAATGGTGTDN